MPVYPSLQILVLLHELPIVLLLLLCVLQVETSCMDDDFGERMQPSAHVKPRRRQYRVKSDMI